MAEGHSAGREGFARVGVIAGVARRLPGLRRTGALRVDGRALVVPGALVAAWIALSESHAFPSYVLPSVGETAAAVAELVRTGELLRHIGASLVRVGAGLLAAAAMGIPLGVWLGVDPRVATYLQGTLHSVRHIPPLAWIPFALMWLKGNLLPAAFITWLGAFFPILLNTMDGVRSVPQGLVDLARSMGSSELQVVRKVVLPAVAPAVLTGIRVGLGGAWMCVVAAEFFGQRFGVGALIMNSYSVLRMDLMVVGMLTIGGLGLVTDRLLRAAHVRLFFWQGR